MNELPLSNSVSVGVLGATGNVGRQVVRRLLADARVSRVCTFNRRAAPDFLPPANDRLHHFVVPMDSGDELRRACLPLLRGVDVVVATMGLGSGRGSPSLWDRVEVELPSAFASAAGEAGVRRAVLLSAVGADAEKHRSWLTLHIARGRYFHLKGTVEANFTAAGFAGGVTIFRPGGLLGTDHLPAFVDRILTAIDPLFPPNWRSIHITQLASAIAASVPASAEGVHIVQGDELFGMLHGRRTDASPAAALLESGN